MGKCTSQPLDNYGSHLTNVDLINASESDVRHIWAEAVKYF